MNLKINLFLSLAKGLNHKIPHYLYKLDGIPAPDPKRQGKNFFKAILSF